MNGPEHLRRCGNCGQSHIDHVRGLACNEFEPLNSYLPTTMEDGRRKWDVTEDLAVWEERHTIDGKECVAHIGSWTAFSLSADDLRRLALIATAAADALDGAAR